MPFGLNKPFALIAVSAALAVLLAGCSTTDTFEQPAPVPEIETSVEFDRVWSMSVGDGHDGEFLQLAPLYAGDVIYAASADGEVVTVAAEDGNVVWEKELDERIFAGPGADGRQLYLVTRDAELVALSSEDGSENWRVDLPTEVLAAPAETISRPASSTRMMGVSHHFLLYRRK